MEQGKAMKIVCSTAETTETKETTELEQKYKIYATPYLTSIVCRLKIGFGINVEIGTTFAAMRPEEPLG